MQNSNSNTVLNEPVYRSRVTKALYTLDANSDFANAIIDGFKVQSSVTNRELENNSNFVLIKH